MQGSKQLYYIISLDFILPPNYVENICSCVKNGLTEIELDIKALAKEQNFQIPSRLKKISYVGQVVLKFPVYK